MKLLVHLHIYYHDQVDYFIKKLSNIEGCDWDLYVTYVEENQQTFDKLKKFKPDTIFIQVENLGYDVWPFIQVIRKANLDDYDYVLKLHTKNFAKKKAKVFGFRGYQWRDTLVNALIGSKRRFRENLIAIEGNKKLGIIFAKRMYMIMNREHPEDTFLLYHLRKRLNIKYEINRFIAGTMFLIKSDILKTVSDSDINKNDFSTDSQSSGCGTLAHTLERIFPMIVYNQNYEVLEVKNFDYFKLKIRRMFYNIFNLRNSGNHYSKILTLFGINFYIKKQPKFPANMVECEQIFKSADNTEFINKRAAVFATFFKDGKISDHNIGYLKEIKKYTDYIIVVSDNPILPSEIEKTKDIADAVIFTRHGEYDFGAYKRGYLKLKDLGILDKVNNLLFFNDSVFYEGKSLQDVFEKSVSKDFYGMIANAGSITANKVKYQSTHIQSWFIMFSDKIFKTDWFDSFMRSVKNENTKEEIIAKYEIGLSKLITDRNFVINTYYPLPEDIKYNPDTLYTHPQNNFENRLFIKKRFIK